MKGEDGSNFMGSSIFWLKAEFEGQVESFKANCYEAEDGSAMT